MLKYTGSICGMGIENDVTHSRQENIRKVLYPKKYNSATKTQIQISLELSFVKGVVDSVLET